MSNQRLLFGIVEENIVLFDGVPHCTEPDIPVWTNEVVEYRGEGGFRALSNRDSNDVSKIDVGGSRASAASEPPSAPSEAPSAPPPHTSSEVSGAKMNKPICDQCQKVCRDAWDLRRHKRTHKSKEVLRGSEELYVCGYNGCKKDYKNPSDVDRHRKDCMKTKPELPPAQSASTSTTLSPKPVRKRKGELTPGEGASTSQIPPAKRARKGPAKTKNDPAPLPNASNNQVPDIIVPQGNFLIISDDVIDPALAYYV